MTINWYGEGCFKIQTDGLVVLTDPFDAKAGLTPPRIKPDVIVKTIASADDLFKTKEEKEGPFLIKGPGEYEIKNIYVEGVPLFEESDKDFLKTAYVLKSEKIKACFFGHLSETPDNKILEELTDIDILVIPAGGRPFISQEAATKLIRQIEPKIVIPSFFAVTGLKRKSADVKEFLKETEGAEEVGEKLTLKKKDLTDDKTKVVILKP